MASQPQNVYLQHVLNPGKNWPNPGILDAAFQISANVLYDMLPGQVAHQNSVGQLEPGCVAWQMPYFMFGGAANLDVMNTPGVNWWPISPRGRAGCFPGKAPMEMWTTEFDHTQTYNANDPLRAPVGNGATAYASGSGQLTNQGVLTWADFVTSSTVSGSAITAGASLPTAICAIAIIPTQPPVATGTTPPTSPVCTNCNGVSVLSFYPIYYPGHPSQTV